VQAEPSLRDITLPLTHQHSKQFVALTLMASRYLSVGGCQGRWPLHAVQCNM